MGASTRASELAVLASAGGLLMRAFWHGAPHCWLCFEMFQVFYGMWASYIQLCVCMYGRPEPMCTSPHTHPRASAKTGPQLWEVEWKKKVVFVHSYVAG